MTKPANRRRGEVAIPELGDGAFVRFTVDSLERLESSYGPKLLDAVLNGLADSQISVVKTCIEVSIIGGPRQAESPDQVDLTEMRDIESVRSALYDAIFLMLYGKTFAEKREEEEAAHLEATAKRLKQINADPHLAALIFSQQFGQPVTEPDSDRMRSAALPPSKSPTSPEIGATIAGS